MAGGGGGGAGAVYVWGPLIRPLRQVPGDAGSVAFHSPPVKIKKEQHSSCSDPSLSCSQKRQFQYHNGEQCLYASAYDQTRQVGIKSPNQGAQMSPIQHFSRQDRGFVNPQSSSQSVSTGGYLVEHGSRYQQPVEMCHSFPSSQNMNRESPATYQRQMSDPCLQYPQQGFKQEYHDPMYEQANRAGTSRAHRYPSNVVIKQEQTDYAYDSGRTTGTSNLFTVRPPVHMTMAKLEWPVDCMRPRLAE
ncbi:hypothetical protein FKM82_021292 [Ascaphus truei]